MITRANRKSRGATIIVFLYGKIDMREFTLYSRELVDRATLPLMLCQSDAPESRALDLKLF